MHINDFQKACDDRVVVLDRIIGRKNPWNAEKWTLAVCGELGELANKLKDVDRGDITLEDALPDLRKECVDIVTYAFHLMSSLGGNMEEELIKKFNIVSYRWVERARDRGKLAEVEELLRTLLERAPMSCMNPECPIGCPDTHAEVYSPEDIVDMDELRALTPEDPLNPELGPEHREYWIRKAERGNSSQDPKVS